jgi:hypothetical protein
MDYLNRKYGELYGLHQLDTAAATMTRRT